MNKKSLSSRTFLVLSAIVIIFLVTFTNVHGENTNIAFAQDIPTETPTPTLPVTPTEEIPTDIPTSEPAIEYTPTDVITEITVTPAPTELPTDTVEEIIPFQESQSQISSQFLNVTFFAPQGWDVQTDTMVLVPGYEEVMGIVLISPDGMDEIDLVSLPEYTDASLENWIDLQAFRLPDDIQVHPLDGQLFGYPAVFLTGHAPDGSRESYVFMDRGENILEVSYHSNENLTYLNEFQQLLASLNPGHSLDVRKNLRPDLADMLVLETAPGVAESNFASVTATAKTLPVVYVDQVYAEYKYHGYDKIWNWCGPSSAAVVLSYLGIEKRDVTSDAQAVADIANNVLESQTYNAPMIWSKLRSYMIARRIWTNYHSTAEAFPSYAEIKSNINAGKPIIVGIQMYYKGTWNGHIVTIVGYRDPYYVIIQDSAGSRMWAQTNWGDGVYSSANSYGRQVTYTWNELNARYKSGWVTFTFPRISSITPTSRQAGSSSFTLVVNGAGFVPASKIKWNGTALTTTYVSDKQLKATISSDKIRSGSVAKVTVFNYDGVNGTSNSVSLTINNPLPTTTGLSHRVISQTGPDLTISITGTGFVPTSKVRLNGADLRTTYISASQLNAVIPSASRTGVGKATISVFNPTPAGGSSNGQILVKVNFSSHVSLLSKHSGKAVDLAGGSTADGAKIQQYTWSSDNSNQWWFMIPTGGSNEYWIISWKSLKCLYVSSTTDGTAVTQKTCDFGSKQRFVKVLVGSHFALKSTWSGDVLDIRDWSTSNEAVIQLWSPTYANNQLWYTK